MAKKEKAEGTEQRSDNQDAALEKAFVEGQLPEEDRRASEVSGPVVEAADAAVHAEIVGDEPAGGYKIIPDGSVPADGDRAVVSDGGYEIVPAVPRESQERINEQLWRDRKLEGQVNHPAFTETQAANFNAAKQVPAETTQEDAERVREQLWRDRKLPGQVNHPDFAVDAAVRRGDGEPAA